MMIQKVVAIAVNQLAHEVFRQERNCLFEAGCKYDEIGFKLVTGCQVHLFTLKGFNLSLFGDDLSLLHFVEKTRRFQSDLTKSLFPYSASRHQSEFLQHL